MLFLKKETQSLIESGAIDISNINRIDIVVGGDHGQGVFRFLMNILYIMNDDTRHDSIQHMGYILCKKDNGIIFKNTIIKDLGDSIKLLNESMLFNNQQLSSSNIYVTGDLVFLVIWLGKEYVSPYWWIKCKSPAKHWKLYIHTIGDEWSIENLKIFFQSGEKSTESLGIKEEPYWDFVEVDNYMCPILHNQLNLVNNVFCNLLDYGNANIEKLSVDEDKVCNSLLMIYSSIDEKVNLRDEFDVSDEGKDLSSLKSIRRNDRTQITNISDDIANRDFSIEELSDKRERFSNDVSKIKSYRFNLKEIVKDGRRQRNRAEFGLEEKICSLLQIYHIKREAWFGGTKLNGVNCRRLMDKNKDIINSIKDIFIELNKCTVSEDNIVGFSVENPILENHQLEII